MATKSKQNPASTSSATSNQDDANSFDVSRPSFFQSSSGPGLDAPVSQTTKQMPCSTPRRSRRERKGPKKILIESPCGSDITPSPSKSQRGSDGTRKSAAKRQTRPKSKASTNNSVKGCKIGRKILEKPKATVPKKPKLKGKAISVVEMKSFIARLNTLQIATVLETVLNFLTTEEHLKKKERVSIVNGLKVSNQLSEMVKVIFQNGVQLLSSGLKSRAEDRQAIYRINFTFFLRGLIFGSIGKEKTALSKWFTENFSGMSIEHLSCVVHSVGAGIYNFFKTKALEFNQESEEVVTRNMMIGGQDNRSENLLASLLVVAGGCLGKIQKVMKTFQRKNYRTKDKVLQSKLDMYKVLRKLLWNIVMTKKEKNNPCLPQTIKQRDRGFMFIPKWVFLTYLRMLDRCVSQTATQNGVELYGKNLIKVTSVTVESCQHLRTTFDAAMSYIKQHLTTNPEVFEKKYIDVLFCWWQRKMVHCRVTQVLSSYYALLAQKEGKMTKGAVTTRDHLYYVATQSKAKHVKI